MKRSCWIFFSKSHWVDTSYIPLNAINSQFKRRYKIVCLGSIEDIIKSPKHRSIRGTVVQVTETSEYLWSIRWMWWKYREKTQQLSNGTFRTEQELYIYVTKHSDYPQVIWDKTPESKASEWKQLLVSIVLQRAQTESMKQREAGRTTRATIPRLCCYINDVAPFNQNYSTKRIWCLYSFALQNCRRLIHIWRRIHLLVSF